MTVAFFVSAAGAKEKPVVVWRSEKPRCFITCPILQSSEIMDDQRNTQVHLNKAESPVVLQWSFDYFIVDNAGCNPDSLKEKFSNIKIILFPANTTSRLQPLDLGIIKKIKVHYRTLFLRYILSKIEECETASAVVQSVNILIAIRWVAQAWSKVKAETITKCFRKAGVLDATMNVVARGEEDDDPFLQADVSLELQGLIDKTMQGSQEKCML